MDSEVCRTCLGSQSLNPIFRNKENHENFSVALENTTGLKIELNDGLPQNICTECMSQINSILKFREKCKDSETQLLQLYQIEKPNTFEDDILQDNEYFLIKMENDEKPLTDMNQTEYLNLEGSFDTDVKSDITILKNEVIDKKYKRRSKNKNKKSSLKNAEKDLKNNLKDGFLDTNTILKAEKSIKVENKRVLCKICKKSLSVRSVDAHVSKRHPGTDERKSKCELCDEYVLKAKLNRHLSMMHGTEYNKCGYCKMEFSDKDTLIEHVASCAYKRRKRKQDTGKEMSECDVCHKKMQKASLRMHQRIQHAGLGPVCDHCGRKFGNKLRLSEHLRSRHGHDKFSCTLCGFRSAALLAMRNHERRHRGEKPFVCESCGARFHAAYLLAQHRQSHRTDKPAKCDLCPATFKANNSLHMHKAACHSNTTYKCTLCERAYSCRNYVLRHLRSVHGYSGPKPHFQLKISE